MTSTEVAHEELGPYRLIAEIGRGGMAEVHLALSRGQGGFHKLVVIKRLREHLLEDPEAARMLLNEARLAGRLSHRNIVQTLDVAEHDGRPYIVMEYLEGQPFAAILEQSRRAAHELDLAASVYIVREALEGLRYAHDVANFDGTPLRLVHRDVSPQNIFVTYDGRIKVLDFGIAKASITESQTDMGILKGKISCMAPEQAMGSAIDARTDLYAVGAVLWHVATGQPLWRNVPQGQALYHIAHGAIPPPSAFQSDVEPELERICCKALSCKQEDRYQDAESLIRDLESLLDSLGSRPTARELGDFVASLFARTRDKTESLVSSRVAEFSFRRTASVPAVKLDSASLQLSNRPVVCTLSSAAPDEPPAPRRHARAGILAGAAALVAGTLLIPWLAFHGGSSVDTTAAAVPPPLDSTPSNPKPVPTFAPIRISVDPGTARLFVNGRRIEQQPADLLLEQGSLHRVRGEAAGFQTREVEFVSGDQNSLHLQLERTGLAHQPATAVPGARPQPQPSRTGDDPGQSGAWSPATPRPDSPRERIKNLDTSNPWGT